MRTVAAVFSYTFKEHVRHKAWLSTALFGLVLLGASLIVSALGQDERARLIVDFGLAGIEAITMVSVVFLTVHLILREIESRAIYLILTHPVRRSSYLLGRFCGTIASVLIGMGAMALIHVMTLWLYGWNEPRPYLISLICILGKVILMSAASLLLSLALTSEAAAMAFACFFWMLGHFSSEIRFLADRAGNAVIKAALIAFSHIAPDFSNFNYRDFLHGPTPPSAWLAWTGLYVLLYTGACFALSAQLFDQKEF